MKLFDFNYLQFMFYFDFDLLSSQPHPSLLLRMISIYLSLLPSIKPNY